MRPPRLSFEAEATARLREQARSRVPDHYDTYTRGEVLVEQGQTIGEEQLILLRLEHDAAIGELDFGDRFRRAFGIFALVTALFVLTASYVYRHERRFVREPRRIAMVCGLVVLALAVIRMLADADLECRAGAGRDRGHDRGHRLQPQLRHDADLRPLASDLRSPWGPRSPTSWS